MTRKLRLLLIEDNPDDAALLLRELARLDYDVTSERHHTAEGVRKALDTQAWDIVISDYALRDFTATDALAILAEKRLDLPLIIISGRIGEETAADLMRAGAKDFLLNHNLTRLGAVIERELREADNRRRRQQTEEELRQSEDRFSRAFAASPIPTVIFTLDEGRVLDANRRFYDLFGYEPDDIIGQNIAEMPVWVNPSDYSLILQWMQAGRAIQDRETRFYARDSQLCYALASTERIEIGGQPCILAMLYDITVRKQAEDRLRRLQTVTASLSEALTPDRVAEIVINEAVAALEASAALVITVNEDNSRLEIVQSTGYESELIASWEPAGLEGEAGPVGFAIRSRAPHWVESTGSPNTEIYHMPLHDSRYKAWVAVPMIVDGQVIGGLGISFRQPQSFDEETMQFITTLADQCGQAMQRARLYSFEHKARLAAEEANQLKLQFLAMISHELRTPLASMKGYTSTLLADDVSWNAEDQQEFIQTIDEETDRLTELVNQLLDVSRLQAGQMSIDPGIYDLMDIIEETLPRLRELVADHDLRLSIPAELPPIHADTNRISQVVANLIENAVRYSDPDTVITVTASQNGHTVQVDVRDEGIGIAEEDAARIFEPFQQLNRREGFRQGTGLGLTICKGLVEAHGGTIWIDSQEGQGTTISFTIPSA